MSKKINPVDVVADATGIENRALLVTLNVSQWIARKLDKRETAKVVNDNNAVSGAATVNKTLLPYCETLQKVHQKTTEIRTFYYHNTSPWLPGIGIIKSTRYIDVATRVGADIEEWNRLVDAFLADYPQQREAARVTLGDLYNEADYPPASSLRSKFKIDVKFMPVPGEGDWRTRTVDEATRARLEQEVRRLQEEGVGNATRDAWERIADMVRHAYERLSDPSTVGRRDSLVENATKLCDVLPSLNILDDPALAEAERQLRASLASVNPDTLKEDASLREDVASKLKAQMADVEARLGAFYS